MIETELDEKTDLKEHGERQQERVTNSPKKCNFGKGVRLQNKEYGRKEPCS